MPHRILAMLPKMLGNAGTVDAVSGDLVPAIEIDAPLQLASFLKNSDAIAPATLTAMEQALRCGEVRVLPVSKLPLRTQYGFIYLKKRFLPPAAIAYMQEVRLAEKDARAREASLAAELGLNYPNN